MAETFGDLPEDVQNEMLSKLADIVAVEREHSAVDGDVRRKIAGLLAGEFETHDVVPEDVLVDRLLGELSPNELRGIVTDWLRVQGAL